MTTVAIAQLERTGCDSIVLAATDLGRPIYERLGFKVESSYHELRGAALPKTVQLKPWRPLLPSDHAAVIELDGQVSGDDRTPILSTFEAYAWGLDSDGRLAGAVIPLPWGGAAATMLPDAGEVETTALVRLIRTVGAVGPEVVVYPPDENRRALEVLRDNGFEELRTVPRMYLGKHPEWQPSAVWNPMSLGLG